MRLLSLAVVTLLFTASASKAEDAPEDLRVQMRPGGISLQLGTYKIGPQRGEVLLHLYVVPAGDEPVGREDVGPGATIPDSPFFLDLFVREQGELKQLNSVQFIAYGDAHEIAIKWLEPQQRRGPIIALRFGVGDEGEWVLVVFPKGLSEEPTVQRFGFSYADYGVYFDRVDPRGFLIVREEWEGLEPSPPVGARRTRLYPWDGVEFTDRSAPYFIIAASVKTRVEAEEFIRQRKLGGEAEIRPSGHYPKLTPGYFIVVLARGQNAKDATKVVARYQKDGIPCYAKRAF